LPARVVDALNLAARSPLAALVKRAGGIAPERAIPPIARRPFTRGRPVRALAAAVLHGVCSKVALHQPDWSRATLLQSRRTPAPAPVAPGRPRLLLWPDTFTNHFDPAVAADAVAVLESLGYAVELPPRTVCCGLTWTTTGQVAAARRVLRRSLRTIEPWLAEGVPVVGLEPSCTAALRSDGPELLPDEPLAARLSHGVRTFAEVLAEHTDTLRATVVAPGQRALVQVHCHQHAELGTEADQAAMAALGIDAEVLDSGCCGLAGNFGFERGHYDVSMACAERVLLPAVRAAAPDVAVLADGFSCRTQLRQAGTREPVHLARLAARALGLTAARQPADSI
jgi:Fe-S oxidoreductase